MGRCRRYALLQGSDLRVDPKQRCGATRSPSMGRDTPSFKSSESSEGLYGAQRGCSASCSVELGAGSPLSRVATAADPAESGTIASAGGTQTGGDGDVKQLIEHGAKLRPRRV